jgi:hypothetical protein
VNWIELAQNHVLWMTVLMIVINLLVPQWQEISLTAELYKLFREDILNNSSQLL